VPEQAEALAPRAWVRLDYPPTPRPSGRGEPVRGTGGAW
jgi:hypothetical protein